MHSSLKLYRHVQAQVNKSKTTLLLNLPEDVEEETEEVQETESDEDGTDSEPEQKKVEDTPPKKKSNSNFAKILAERNALRRQLKRRLTIIW